MLSLCRHGDGLFSLAPPTHHCHALPQGSAANQCGGTGRSVTWPPSKRSLFALLTFLMTLLQKFCFVVTILNSLSEAEYVSFFAHNSYEHLLAGDSNKWHISQHLLSCFWQMEQYFFFYPKFYSNTTDIATLFSWITLLTFNLNINMK